LAALVAEALGLPGNPPAAAATSRNKLATREALQRAGLDVPAFRVLPVSPPVVRPRELVFPLVVKPLALSASRGVIRVNDAAEFDAAVERIGRLLRAPDVRAERDVAHEQLLVETFIPGREYAVEGLLTNGVFRALTIFDKPDPLDGPFFEETIYVTPSRAAAGVQEAIVKAIGEATQAIGLRHGPVHAECRVNDAGVWVLEVAARPIGGLCSKALRFTGGMSLEEVLLRHALGDDVSSIEREPEASAVMMIPIPRRGVYKGVEGIAAARAVAGVDDVRITAKEDTVVVPLPEGRSYLGFLFAHAEAPAAAEQAVREAHARLRFRIDREVALL
jgi:biotin carboxylase